ncbi:hypothetical protein BCR26_06275 [Enterococcus rivorum]|uniref:Uncharacterized protein n=1 Tax=Enterococcus rivorum TaxID=762845 RepID=A0A1E5KSI1_9ENTE|nr:hypothetical protein BCR26_06275 [Enterococcus rivorum]
MVKQKLQSILILLLLFILGQIPSILIALIRKNNTLFTQMIYLIIFVFIIFLAITISRKAKIWTFNELKIKKHQIFNYRTIGNKRNCFSGRIPD